MKSENDWQMQSPEARLQNLITLFFQELRAFGLFSAFKHPDRKRVEKYLQSRVALFNLIVQFAELNLDLTLDEQTGPILYNTGHWPENAPIAGYGTEDSGVKYSDLIYTYIGNWIYESDHKKPINSRFLLAALWMWEKYDFKSALNYLLDLQKYGYVTRGLQDTVEVLLRFQASGKSKQEIMAIYFKGDSSSFTNADWISKSTYNVFRTLSKLAAKPDLTVVQPILGSIVMDTLKEMKYARTLADPTDWMLQQMTVMLRCDLVLELFRRFSLKPTIMMKSILSQFEEIRADSGLYRLGGKSERDFAPLSNPVEPLLTGLLIITRYNYGEAGETRMYNDRLLYPEVRRDVALQILQGQEISKISPDKTPWEIIPPRIVNPFVATYTEALPLATLRRELFSTEQIEQIPAIEQFFKRLSIHSPKNQRLILEEAYRGSLSWLQEELDEGKEHPSYIRLTEKQKKQFITLLNAVHQELSVQELSTELETSWQAGDNEEKQRILEHLCFLYPWSAPVYQELSIFYDQSGNPHQAWEPIVTAALLSPDNPIIWRSFAVILGRLGNDADASLSLAIHEYLAGKENK